MQYLIIQAENVLGVNSLIEELRRARYYVTLHAKDPVFDSTTMFLVKTERNSVDSALNLIWDYNDGAHCVARAISEEEFYNLYDF
jgi:hypothetical protein